MAFDLAWWIWFVAAICLLLSIDIWLMHRAQGKISRKRAICTTCFWVSLALLFAGFIYLQKGPDKALEFLTGYVIEESLSIDNLFVFLLIFKYFKVPKAFQYRVLMWGILGALVMRFTFIIVGIALVQKLHWLLYVFGLFLIVTGIAMFKKERQDFVPKDNIFIKLVKKFMPVSHDWGNGKFFIKEQGVLHATPLFLVLLTIEMTDVLFALDSIPAVFAITLDPFIVFSCNAMAILGLRALYFVLQDLLDCFTMLHYGVCLILIFVGLKMLIAPFYLISTPVSLAIVAAIVTASILLSCRKK